jgi:integrase
MATAADDELIRRNPCRLKGASAEKSPERPVLTVTEVYALADAVGSRYRAMVLMACFCGLRWGELAALRCCDIDTNAAIVRVTRQLTEAPGQPMHFGPPKSAAGRRVVVIPPLILPDVRAHLAGIAAHDPEVIVFTSPAGKLLRHGNFRRGIWLPALSITGLAGVHFHDLRHAGNHLVASAGASLRELMERMGHSSSRAALIYQHSTDERQRALAETVARQAQAALDAGARGTYGARPAPAVEA